MPSAVHHLGALIFLATICNATVAAESASQSSHPPLRPLPLVSSRTLSDGPSYFLDASRGDDTGPGTQERPWQSLAHAVRRLQPGDTLCLRGGVYYENVYLALSGRPNAPITIRGYPGEQAVLDGGLSEFYASPQSAWEPVPGSRIGEYRSTATYPNLRNVVGSFGDSRIGLQTYYHAQDLRADSELLDWEDWERRDESDLRPLYCGPGIWYDRASGRIHVRLAHTRLPEPIDNYRGPTDPRQLPLVIARFRSVPLTVDRGEHLCFQDLSIRGAGYTAIILDQAVGVSFDNVTVWCGTYGMQVSGTRQFRFIHSSLHGNVAPWTFRGDGSKRDYPGRPHRNISRLNTHALLEIESGRESSVYATPQNDDWEIAHSQFTDAHDAVYLGAINVRFHHNLVENMQDDGLYLSPMYLRHRLDKKDPEIHVFQNVFRRVLTALAFGGSESETRDQIYIYRNFFDLRPSVNTGRPSTRSPQPGFSTGKLMGDHGSPPWPAMKIYHNTVVTADPQRDAAMGALSHTRAGNTRRTFNNIFFHFGRLPGLLTADPALDSVGDANLYWSPQVETATADKLFARFRSSPAYAASKEIYADGSTTNSIVADPQFVSGAVEAHTLFDYRLNTSSPAIDAGILLPANWPDPLRGEDRGPPDLGALPAGSRQVLDQLLE